MTGALYFAVRHEREAALTIEVFRPLRTAQDDVLSFFVATARTRGCTDRLSFFAVRHERGVALLAERQDLS
jgi:hypothetical protein